MQQHYEQIQSLNAELIAISPQTIAKNSEIKKKQRLEFAVLSDPGNQYADQLSITFKFPDDLKTVYEEFGIVLPEFNGDDSWRLPMPTRLIVDSDGQIQYINADPDYTHRPEPDETIEALKQLAE